MRPALLLILCAALAGAAPSSAPSAGKTLGVAVAPIMIEVYSDFQCPSCKVFHETTLRTLIKEYVTPGKAYMVFREYPLPMHAHAMRAAQLATAAAKAGKYEAVSDALFAKQASWSVDGKVEEAALSVLSPAEVKTVRQSAALPATAAEVASEVQFGRAAKVNSTPTLVITHRLKQYPISGTVSYYFLKKVLDDLLAK
jgi:protein-disulfide isomerase